MLWNAPVKGSSSFYPHLINQSLRFNDNDSAYLSWTPSVSGDRKTWTWSGWVKRTGLNVQQELLAAGTTGLNGIDNRFYIFIGSANGISIGDGAINYRTTARVFRDTSAFFHLHVIVDTTESVADDRVKIYVNGILENSFSQNNTITLNATTVVNSSTHAQYMGRSAFATQNFFDGYLSDVHFIDGQALDPTSFGEFKGGVWIPKEYIGTYGTNGFHLDFADSGDIGNDVSGNANDWAPVNLSSYDVVPDSPTNNFATLNTLDVSSVGVNRATFQNGNLDNISNSGNFSYHSAPSTISVSSGKWYAEVYIHTQNATTSSGISIGNLVVNSNITFTSSQIPQGSIVGVLFDASLGTYEFRKNDVLYSSGSLPTLDSYHVIPQPVTSGIGQLTRQIVNFGQDSSFAGNKTAQGNTDANGIGDFYYAPPAGYLALCTANLPTISTPYEVYVSPSTENDYFEGTYTGNGSVDGPFIYTGFKPTDIVVDGVHYPAGHADFDFNANGVKLRSATTVNTNSTTYTLEAWVDEDFKYANAGIE